MATVWTYPPEILPLKIRAKGAALAAAADFLGNFLVVEVTPVGVANLGFGFYFIWAALNLCNAVIVWLFYPETANMQLESIDMLFTKNIAPEDVVGEKQPFYRKMQWKAVAVAAAEEKRLRRERQGLADSTGSSFEEASVGEDKDMSEKIEDVVIS